VEAVIAFCQALFPWYVGIVTVLVSLLIMCALIDAVWIRLIRFVKLERELISFMWERASVRNAKVLDAERKERLP
jgi:hypothetical protein